MVYVIQRLWSPLCAGVDCHGSVSDVFLPLHQGLRCAVCCGVGRVARRSPIAAPQNLPLHCSIEGVSGLLGLLWEVEVYIHSCVCIDILRCVSPDGLQPDRVVRCVQLATGV